MTNPDNIDKLFANPFGEIHGFKFDETVVDVFPDMLDRSVPGYQSIIAQSGLLAQRFAIENSNCYDLGCSLGATLLAMRQAIEKPGCTLIGIDNSPAMIEKCHQLIEHDSASHSDSSQPTYPVVQLVCENLVDTRITNASVVALNFTLQFVNPDSRSTLLRRISDGMHGGGALILSEKIEFEDPLLNELFIDRYYAFKKANGYSELEISQKRTALENVLMPDTLETHRERLNDAGFKHISVWFQCFNFVSIIAIK